MKTTNIRIHNDNTWRKIKAIARRQHISANSLINRLLDQFVARHNVPDQNEDGSE